MINHPPPWVQNGAEIKEGESTNSWLARAGLAFGVNKRSVYFYNAQGKPRSIPNAAALVRSDNGEALSIVSQNRYKIVQPKDIIDLYHQISTNNDLKLEAGGSLKGGRIVWALASTGKKFEVKGDPLTEYILFSTGFDGKATKGTLMTRRDSCWNTMEIAMRRGSSKVSVTHAQRFDTAKVTLGLGFNSFTSQRYISTLNRLAEARISKVEAREFFRNVYFPEIDQADLSTRQSNKLDVLIFIYAGGVENASQKDITGTLWGIVNTVTFDQDHATTARSDDNRMASAWFGKGRSVKLWALDRAMALV